MDAWERTYEAVSGRVPDRVPVVPKIWVDLGARLTGIDLLDVVRDPLTAMRAIADAGRLCRVDAVRLFHFPERRVGVRDGRTLEIGADGEPAGEIDLAGGLATRLFDAGRYDVTDPYTMAHHHHWSADRPVVRDEADAGRIVVPPKRYYEEIGCGDRLERLGEELGQEVAVLGDCSSGTMAFLVCLRGMTQAMVDLIDEPALVHRIMEKGIEIAVEKAKFNIDRGIEVLRLNDSVGNMSVMSPAHWREFVFPRMKAFCDEVHAYSPRARVYCHICGNVLPIAEDLVAAGLDCIGPLDPLGGFTPAQVRDRIGNAVSLMGGVNTLSFVNGTPEEVLAEARRCIEEAGAEGGFILGSGCVVPRAALKENLLALREAAERYGRYRDGALIAAG